MMGLSLALGLAAAGTHSDAARTLDAGAIAPTPQRCLGQRDGNSDQPACYENSSAAFWPPSPCRLVHTAASAPCERKRYEPARCSRPGIAAAPSHHKFSAAERDELYREFQKWRERPTTE